MACVFLMYLIFLEKGKEYKEYNLLHVYKCEIAGFFLQNFPNLCNFNIPEYNVLVFLYFEEKSSFLRFCYYSIRVWQSLLRCSER